MPDSTPPTRKFDLVRIFPVILLVLFVSQFVLWNCAVITDLDYWVTKRTQLISDIKDHNLDFAKINRATHPGTFPLIVSLPFSSLGFSAKYSIKTACILLDTLLSVGIVYAAYFAKRNNLWWLAIIFFFAVNDYTLYTNPSDIITAKLISLSLILLLIFFQLKKNTHWIVVLAIGIALGLAASSRIHPVIILLPFVIMAFAFLDPKKIPLLLLSFGISMFVTNPYLWDSPIHFLTISFFRGSDLLLEKSHDGMSLSFFQELSLGKLIAEAPLSFLAYVFLFINLFVTKKHQILPRLYIFIIIMFSSLFSFLLLRSPANTLRYFYPALIPLQIMLPILIFQLFNFAANTKIIQNTRISSKKYLYIEILITIFATIVIFFSSNDTILKISLDISKVMITISFLHVLHILSKNYFLAWPKKATCHPKLQLLPQIQRKKTI